MMQHNDKWDYVAQIMVKSKAQEKKLGLTKIGNFDGIDRPQDSTIENPLVAMPFFGFLKRDDKYPNYEDQICSSYRRYGKYMNVAKK